MRLGPIASALAAALALGAAACTQPTVFNDARVTELAAAIGAEEIARSPETASALGASSDLAGSDYRSRLDDRSIAASQRVRARRVEILGELERVDRAALSPDGLRLLDTATLTYAATVRIDRHGYGIAALGWASPYLINQSDGAYDDIVKLLTSRHTISSRADAEAWLARLRAAPVAMRDELRRFELDISNGGMPSRRILERTLERVRSLQTADPRENLLAQYFAESLSQIPDIPEADITAMIDEAVKVIGGDLSASYRELAAALETALKTAPDEPGVWRLRNGESYYADALKLYTTTEFTPDEVHQIGLALVEEITARMDAALGEMGIVEGPVAERMAVLAADPLLRYLPAPEGEAAMIADIEARIRWGQTNLSRIVSLGPAQDVALRQAPMHAQATAPLAYYKPSSLDGARPAAYTLNMRTAIDTPVWSIPTLTFHEAIPGHHLQSGLARDIKDQPILLSLIATPALSEGWAVYAEDLAAELGAYNGEAENTLGYLQSILFRAARLVVDTGIHHKRWSHTQAVDYLVSVTGLPRAAMENEVDRYTIRPGHATTYMIGREKIRNLREGADVELGPDFDLKAFHDTILAHGGRPLDVVERDVQAWVAGVKARRAPPVAQ
jgi:uncharacterized protein (DUF885 family)